MTRHAWIPAVLLVLAVAGCGGSSGTAVSEAAEVPVTAGPADAPQVGSGAKLAKAVKKVVEANGATAKVACADFTGHALSTGTIVGKAGAIVDCRATITPPDDRPKYKTGIRVKWDDDQGHFTTAEQAG